jgi:quinol-cytochrome oxidoreductase complex cytochrome b subunit
MAITDFLTCWSLLISYSIFIIAIFFNNLIPLYIFLTAACLLSSTSIMGTLFITGPTMAKEDNSKDKLIIFSNDILVHIGPFLLLLLLFKFIVNRIKLPKNKEHKESSGKFFIISFIIFLIIGLSYHGIVNPISKNVYKDSSVVISIILLVCVYCSIYQIYYNQVLRISGNGKFYKN